MIMWKGAFRGSLIPQGFKETIRARNRRELLTHSFQFGIERSCGLLHLSYFALQQAHALARSDDVVLELLEDGARVSGQVRELTEAARERHVADGAQVLEEQTLITGHGVSAQQLRLHDPFRERHFFANRSALLLSSTTSRSCKLIREGNVKKNSAENLSQTP